MTKKNEKNLQLKKIKHFLVKIAVYCTYPKASIKDVPATEEAFSPQKRTSSTSKHKIFCGPFSHLGSPGSGSTDLYEFASSRSGFGSETLRRSLGAQHHFMNWFKVVASSISAHDLLRTSVQVMKNGDT
jgi:hypothetical protein